MITPTTIFEATIMYGIVHLIGEVTKRVVKKGVSEVRKERNRIIRNHVKADHEGRLKHCIDEACASLRKPAQPQPAPLAEQAVQTDQ
jgi:hypothetical protein